MKDKFDGFIQGLIGSSGNIGTSGLIELDAIDQVEKNDVFVFDQLCRANRTMNIRGVMRIRSAESIQIMERISKNVYLDWKSMINL